VCSRSTKVAGSIQGALCGMSSSGKDELAIYRPEDRIG